MSCCNPSISSFVNEVQTTVPYTGSRPIVSVLYLMPDNTMQEAGIFTHIEITPTEVIITHPTAYSGVVKLLQ